MADGRELPPNWRTAHADDGKEYYFNELTGETSWSIPAMPPPSDAHAPAKVPPLVAEVPQPELDSPEPAQPVATMDGGVMPGSDMHVGVSSVNKFSQPLGPTFPKLLVIWVCSTVVMIQASIEYGRSSQEFYVAGVGRVDAGAFPSRSTAYAVSVGTVSLSFVIILLLLVRKKPHIFSSFQLRLPKNKGTLSLQQCYAIFFALWWSIGAGVLTFHAPYNYTCNAYFATWIACFMSLSMLMDTFTRIVDVWQRVSVASSSDQHVQLDWIIALCSAAVFFASIDYLDIGQGQWAMICSVFSLLTLGLFAYLKRAGKAGPRTLKGLAALLMLFWVFGAGVTTFDEPFKGTGNGFFASWIALATAASKAYAVSMNRKILWPGTLRRSLSLSAEPLTSELPMADPSRV